MEKCNSFNERESPRPWPGLAVNDRRFAYWRHASFKQSQDLRESGSTSSLTELKPFLSRNSSSIDIPPFHSFANEDVVDWAKDSDDDKKDLSLPYLVISAFNVVSSGSRQIKRLFLLITLNVAYSTTELLIGLLTGRVGLVSDAFHLTFGCGLLTFSLFSMAASKRKPDRAYTYGYKRLEVLSAFTNALFLMFLSFSLAVEALHAFIQDESEHKHYLIVSAVTNLLVNLVGVWFFRNYARINLVYRNAEDMNYHSVCLHVISDSIRSAGIILASWFLSLGINNSEVLCLALVSVVIFLLTMPLFKASGGILLQMAPPNVPTSAFSKCSRQVDNEYSSMQHSSAGLICNHQNYVMAFPIKDYDHRSVPDQVASHGDVEEVFQSRFWELAPAHLLGSISLKVKEDADDRRVLQYVHHLYDDLGVQELTVQIDS